jgi:SAM-dependent methyltransferase
MADRSRASAAAISRGVSMIPGAQARGPVSSTVLDLGCGRNKTPGALGVDRDPEADADLVADLDVHPYDLPTGRFARIVCRHVIEHLADVPAFFDELYRLAAPNARIEIETPHFSNRCSYTDPTHRHHLSVQFVDFFAERLAERPGVQSGTGARPGALAVGTNYLFEHRFDYEPDARPARFVLVSQTITFSRLFRFLGVAWFANRCWRFWEFYLAFLLPARDIRLVLAVRK